MGQPLTADCMAPAHTQWLRRGCGVCHGVGGSPDLQWPRMNYPHDRALVSLWSLRSRSQKPSFPAVQGGGP